MKPLQSSFWDALDYTFKFRNVLLEMDQITSWSMFPSIGWSMGLSQTLNVWYICIFTYIDHKKNHHSWIVKYTIPIEWAWHLRIAYNIHPTPAIHPCRHPPKKCGKPVLQALKPQNSRWFRVPGAPSDGKIPLTWMEFWMAETWVFWWPKPLFFHGFRGSWYIWMVDVYGKWWQMNTQMLRGMGIFTSRHFPLFMWPFFYLSGTGK